MAIIKIEKLTKKFGAFTALNNVSFEVKKGEIYGFIGPNGAGKTTTIRVLLGILKATTGSAQIFTKDAWTDAVEIHKNISYVPGEVSLWSNLTGGEVIDLFMRLHGTSNNKKKAELIKLFDLDPTKKCGTYSKGNRQKVALIAALASDADLFILDEPTSGLDPLMEKVFQDCVMEIKKAGKTVFLSSHILSEVEKLCDKVSIIREGKIIETGSLDELRHLTRTNVYVETKMEVTELNKINGVYNIEGNNKAFSFEVEPDEISKVIKYISAFDITKFESAPPTLEELFMRHYEGAEHDA
jgi:ABC-2 type transport system ATP-binding protein